MTQFGVALVGRCPGGLVVAGVLAVLLWPVSRRHSCGRYPGVVVAGVPAVIGLTT